MELRWDAEWRSIHNATMYFMYIKNESFSKRAWIPIPKES